MKVVEIFSILLLLQSLTKDCESIFSRNVDTDMEWLLYKYHKDGRVIPWLISVDPAEYPSLCSTIDGMKRRTHIQNVKFTPDDYTKYATYDVQVHFNLIYTDISSDTTTLNVLMCRNTNKIINIHIPMSDITFLAFSFNSPSCVYDMKLHSESDINLQDNGEIILNFGTEMDLMQLYCGGGDDDIATETDTINDFTITDDVDEYGLFIFKNSLLTLGANPDMEQIMYNHYIDGTVLAWENSISTEDMKKLCVQIEITNSNRNFNYDEYKIEFFDRTIHYALLENVHVKSTNVDILICENTTIKNKVYLALVPGSTKNVYEMNVYPHTDESGQMVLNEMFLVQMYESEAKDLFTFFDKLYKMKLDSIKDMEMAIHNYYASNIMNRVKSFNTEEMGKLCGKVEFSKTGQNFGIKDYNPKNENAVLHYNYWKCEDGLSAPAEMKIIMCQNKVNSMDTILAPCPTWARCICEMKTHHLSPEGGQHVNFIERYCSAGYLLEEKIDTC